MKAKEYAAQFLEKPSESDNELDNKVATVALSMMQDAIALCKIRNSTSNSALIAALKEQRQKWRAFANIVNKALGKNLINPAGFKDFVIAVTPEFKGHL